MAENRSIGGYPNSLVNELKKGKNYFFAIGINKYQNDKIPKLVNACRDILDLAQLLKEDYSFYEQELLLDEDATRSNIINKLNELPRKIAPDDKLLIYYSGHGKVDENDKSRGYWIPVDGEINDVSSYVTNADVTDIVKSIDARHLLLISDSCFSAALLQKFRSVDAEGAFDSMENSKSRWAFVSGKGVVSDGEEGGHSPFANGIIKQLKKNQDKINISLLADQVIKQVSNLYDQDAVAIPLRTMEHEEGGQFVFVKKQTEKDDWDNAQAINSEVSYVDYITKYPNGAFVKEAKQKLRNVEDECAWDEAIARDTASSYLDYLELYPKGKHIAEANAKLDAIRNEKIRENKETQESIQQEIDRIEKEKALVRNQKQELVFQAEKERKAKELADQQAQKNKSSVPEISPNRQSVGSGKQTAFLKYIPYIGFFLLLAGGFFVWQKSTITQSTLEPKVPVVDTTVDLSFEMQGDVIDAVTNQKLTGITLINSRTKKSAVSDSSGHFILSQNLNGDSILTNETDQYLARSVYVKNNTKIEIVDLQERPRVKENKIITGNVSLRDPIKGIYVYVKRKKSTVKSNGKYGTHTLADGKFTLSGVNEGDVLWFDTGRGKFSKTISRENTYNLVGTNIITN